MAITPKNRSVEMGRVILAPALKKLEQPEAQYFALRYVFEDLNYRRYGVEMLIVSTALLPMQPCV